jgi:DnaK suppressor protein
MRPANWERYRTRLLDIQARLRNDVNRMIEAAAEDIRKPGDLSNVPTHNADQDAEGLDSEIALIQNEQGIRAAVGAALARLDEGTYGTCEQCGGRISKPRLDAIPYTPYCRDCAKQIEAETEFAER